MPLGTMPEAGYRLGMNESRKGSRFKMAAIDLDGTLLSPDGTISQVNREAVRRLHRAGLEVVLASGRHFRSMLPYAESLPQVRWLVSSQGGEVSDLLRTVVMASECLSAVSVRELIQTGQSRGLASVVFGVAGVFTTSAWNADLQFYTDLDGLRPVYCQVDDLLHNQMFKVVWAGSSENVEQQKRRCRADFPDLQVVQTGARFLEFMPKATTKAFGLRSLAGRLGVRASEALVFGDGDNDVPMFQWAGLSVAMSHGWPAALKAASRIAPAGPADSALARGIDWLFSEGLLEVQSNDTTGSSFGARSADRERVLLARI